jgi:hypothetical protein
MPCLLSTALATPFLLYQLRRVSSPIISAQVVLPLPHHQVQLLLRGDTFDGVGNSFPSLSTTSRFQSDNFRSSCTTFASSPGPTSPSQRYITWLTRESSLLMPQLQTVGCRVTASKVLCNVASFSISDIYNLLLKQKRAEIKLEQIQKAWKTEVEDKAQGHTYRSRMSTPMVAGSQVTMDGGAGGGSTPFCRACENYGHQGRTSKKRTQNPSSEHYQGAYVE